MTQLSKSFENSWRRALLGAATLWILAACSNAGPPRADSFGPHPRLPAADLEVLPTVNVAKAKAWASGSTPLAAPGLTVHAYAEALDHPRWLYVLPNGDVLVAETSAPTRPQDAKGIRAWIMGLFMKKAGAAVPSADRISLLRDSDGDGRADLRTVFLKNLHSPFGMALVGSEFYVANTDAVLKFAYSDGQTTISTAGSKLLDLPAGARNHHWTKNLIASADGSTLYVSVGSNSNIAEYGMAEEQGRAAIWAIDRVSGKHRIFASGLRNANGMAFEPSSGALWTAVNERDLLGPDLVPDYMTAVRDGGFYGWPYSYFGQHVDDRPQPPRPDLVASAIAPDYALGAHTASLGLAYSDGNALAQPFRNGMFIGQHGSWNRRPRSGYKVIFVAFADGQPVGLPIDVLSGFISAKDEANGRPVGVAFDRSGALLVADDVGNVVWRVAAAQQAD